MNEHNGEPCYRVSRIPGHWIFRWAVMCGTGTGPVYLTWRFLQAQRIRSLLENAYADGHFVGSGQYAASKEVERLRQQIDGYDAAIASRDLEIERLRPALKVARQAILEFGHAQANGPGWYTRGKEGMYAQVRTWLQRGMEAIAVALDPPCNCPPDRPVTAGHAGNCPRHLRSNARSYSQAFVLELLGYLTGAIPELHAFESGKMIQLLEEFEQRSAQPNLLQSTPSAAPAPTLTFIVNGTETPFEVDLGKPLLTFVTAVLDVTGNTGRPPEHWELRNVRGSLLDSRYSAQQLGLTAGARVFLSPQVGCGG